MARAFVLIIFSLKVPQATATGTPAHHVDASCPEGGCTASGNDIDETPLLQLKSSKGGACDHCDSCEAVPGNKGGGTDAQCAKCANGGYAWWPCQGTQLCRCANGQVTTPPPPPPPSPPPSPPPVITTEAPTTAAPVTTATPQAPGTTTAEALSKDCAACSNCVAVPGKNQGATDSNCAQCANGGYSWWPCNTDLCHCADGGNPATTTPTPGTTAAVPGTTNPAPGTTSAAATTPAPQPIPPGNGKKLMLFLENWHSCPTMEMLSRYTHVIISFAVTYQWNAAKNICSNTCEIGQVAVCDNAPNMNKIAAWQSAGIKVLLSFGGAGMGGSWAGDNNDCWEHCFGRAAQVSDQLMSVVNTYGFDGVDIDYEYHHTQVSTEFLTQLNEDLGSKLHAAGKTLSHAPMDGDITAGRPYYALLQNTASYVDYLLPQYYNGPFRPAIDEAPALSHMGDLVSGIFNGNANKVLFGFCAEDCSGTGSNIDGNGAAKVLESVQVAYPNFGGAFLWAGMAERNSHWSVPVKAFFNSL